VHSVCRGGWDFADKGRFPCHLGRKNDLLCILHAEAATAATETEAEAKARGKERGQDNIKKFIKVEKNRFWGRFLFFFGKKQL
jgi:hypothetical protein